MLYLYPKNTVDFTNNGDPIHNSYDEHVIRDDGFYLTFNLLLDKEEDYKKIKKEMIISADTPDGINQFRIYDIKNKSTSVEVTAVQLMYDFDNKEINPFSLKNSTGSQVISRFKSSFKSTLGQFTMDSSVTETHDFATNDEDDDAPSHNALEVLNRITNRWDSELMLNGFDIRMIKRLGAKTDALLYEKKNISEFEDASSVSGMITRIHTTSKFTPEGKEDEVILSVTVDSPLINEYAQIYEKSYVNNDCRTEAELIAWTKLKYSTENVDKPSRSITVSTNIIDGTEINYGDDLVLKYLVHDVDEIIRCVGYDYDPIKNTYYSVTLGDWKDSFATTLTGGIVDKTNQQLNRMKNNITYISMSANGKNRNAYGPEPVPNPINGDNWYYYEFDRPNDVELRIFQDGFWIAIDFATKKEVEAVIDQADIDRAKAEQEINQALTNAKNYTEVKAQEFNNQILIVNQNVLTATNSANAAVLKADKAIEDVGFMKIDVAQIKSDTATALSTANAAKTDASSALSKSNTAITDSTAALTKANKAIADSGTAITNAANAVSRVGAVEVTTGNLTTSYDTLSQTVGLKADKTVVDGINGKVTTQGTAITANATAIGLKADKTVVDTINGVVTKHTTDIKVVADGLLLKADSSVVNTLNGTVTAHTTQIKAASDGLLLKADSSTVNTIKGTVDTHTTQIKATSDGLALKAEKSLVDTINSTVGNHTTQIKATSDGLALKAEKSLVDTVKSTVDTHTTQIKATSDGLELKAESSLVDSVKGIVNSHTTQINANSQAITARLTSVQIETLLTGKQYVNQTALNATSSGLTAQITQVSTDLSNLEIGGTNLVYNSEIPPFSPINYNGGTYVVSKVLENVPFLNVSTVTEVSRTVGGGDFRPPDITIDDGRNREYTVSVWVRPVSPSVSLTLTLGVNDKEMTGKTVVLTDATKWIRVTYSKKFSANIDGTLLRVYLNLGENQKARFSKIKLEKGIKATDWSPSPNDMATLEKVVTIEANIDGINTLVASKASQAQVTQLAGQITTKVESATYNSKMTQLDSAINLRVVQGDVTAAILADKTIKDTRATNELPSWYFANYPKQTVEEFKTRNNMGGIPGIATFGQLTTKVLWNSTSGGSITQIFSSSDGVFQRQGNSGATAWLAWDKIAEAGKLISQINVSTEGILLQGKRIQLDGDVTMTAAFVTRLDVLTLSSVYADIATLKSRVLTANVITADMLQTNVSIINKLFATDTMVTTLTAKTSFINSVKAIDIAADRITTGNLNAANVNIINLNVSKIVGLNSAFIQTAWNSLSSSVNIDAGGVVTTASSGAQTLLQNGVLYTKTPKGSGLGTIGYALDATEDLFTIDIIRGNSWAVRYQVASGSTNYSDVIGYYDYLDRVTINKATQINGELNMNNQLISNVKSITTPKIDYMPGRATYATGEYMDHTSYTGFRFYMNTYQALVLSRNHSTNLNSMSLYAGLNMQGYTITNQSDRRLKKDIVDSSANSLMAISRWNFVNYEWRDPLKPTGVKLGLIAQDTPELAVYDFETDIYSIDSSKQTMMNSHAIQQLNSKVVSMVSIVNSNQATMNQALNAANTALSETQKLKQEVQELRQKIKNLESAA